MKRAEQGKLKMSVVKENSRQFWERCFKNSDYDYKSLVNVKNVLNKNTKDFVLLNDGTRNYIRGKFKNMLWRYGTDKEIKDLCKDFTIMEFNKRKNGRRNVWIKKKS
ncbi:hypothetical protein ES705_46323 [subsurface metagenome]